MILINLLQSALEAGEEGRLCQITYLICLAPLMTLINWTFRVSVGQEYKEERWYLWRRVRESVIERLKIICSCTFAWIMTQLYYYLREKNNMQNLNLVLNFVSHFSMAFKRTVFMRVANYFQCILYNQIIISNIVLHLILR